MMAHLKESNIPKEALIVTIDASSLYSLRDGRTSAHLTASNTTVLPPDIQQSFFDILQCKLFHFKEAAFALKRR